MRKEIIELSSFARVYNTELEKHEWQSDVWNKDVCTTYVVMESSLIKPKEATQVFQCEARTLRRISDDKKLFVVKVMIVAELVRGRVVPVPPPVQFNRDHRTRQNATGFTKI